MAEEDDDPEKTLRKPSIFYGDSLQSRDREQMERYIRVLEAVRDLKGSGDPFVQELLNKPVKSSASSRPADLKLRRNEKVKAFADILNKAAGAFLAAAVIAPVAGLALNPAATNATFGVYLALAAVGVSAAVLLHIWAGKVLDRLEG